MDEATFYEHLKKCAGDSSSENWGADNLYGYFGRFRPDGEGLEAVFEPVNNGAAYVARLKNVFKAAKHAKWQHDGYFVVRKARRASSGEIIAFGEMFVENLRGLAETIKKKNLKKVLGELEQVELVKDELDQRSNEHGVVYDVVGDFFAGQQDYKDFVPRLGEAFYSIACNPELTQYLMWPYFEGKLSVDVYLPYFELWKRGYTHEFKGKKLLLAKR